MHEQVWKDLLGESGLQKKLEDQVPRLHPSLSCLQRMCPTYITSGAHSGDLDVEGEGTAKGDLECAWGGMEINIFPSGTEASLEEEEGGWGSLMPFSPCLLTFGNAS